MQLNKRLILKPLILANNFLRLQLVVCSRSPTVYRENKGTTPTVRGVAITSRVPAVGSGSGPAQEDSGLMIILRHATTDLLRVKDHSLIYLRLGNQS